MDRIEFKYVIPKVFAHREQQDSDIWQQEVSFQRGSLYLVQADSGRGKSTFCSYIIGYRNDYSGQVCFDARNTRHLEVSEWVQLRQCHLSYLFQELRLFPELTAYENVEIKNKLTGHKTRQQIEEWFDMLGISDKLDAKVDCMSFGQQQRVAMIRSLVQPFDFLLADEPVSHLDDTNARIMGDIMIDEARRQGAGIIVTSIGKHIDLNYERVLHL